VEKMRNAVGEKFKSGRRFLKREKYALTVHFQELGAAWADEQPVPELET
jgi:hypothetical protein